MIEPTTFDQATLSRVRARLAALEVRRLGDVKQRAAVLVPLCTVEGVPGVLFTKRTETVGTHKGQVAFPGGRVDPGDRDVVDTALRELAEEVGIDRDRVDVLGVCHEVTAITGVGVSPVVGFVGEVVVADLRLQPSEVEVAFVVPLATMVDPQHRTLQSFDARRAAPQFTGGLHRVWGLTAFILDEFLQDGLGLALPVLRSHGVEQPQEPQPQRARD